MRKDMVWKKMRNREHHSFLVSFLVDARGGAMRGCRHSGVRVIVPPRKAAMPMRITCRYLRKDRLSNPPPLMEGEALASRILELGPVGAKFLGPVIIEVPHFASLRGKEREIIILRSDNGDTWREHTLEASEEAVQDVLNESFEGEEMSQLEDLHTNRITRILTVDFPHYFAVVSRVKQEVHAIGPEGGMVSSSVVPQVQAVFPQDALTKKIRVGIQAQPISADLAAKLLGNRVAVSPIVTVEPRRRKFHKPITLTIPVPQAANKGMINQYSGDAPTLRLLCSITGGTTRAQWEDVTGSTPLTFVKDCVTFTTTVSARFWLMDCRNIADATKMATELYRESVHPPFMAKFVVFAKRVDLLEARLRVFCMTDDKEDKTLEHQEHFTEVAKSKDVEVQEGKTVYIEFAGNLIPVMKSGDQLQMGFRAFKENRLPFTVRVKDPDEDTVGRILFMREPKVAKGEPAQTPVCTLNIVLPDNVIPDAGPSEPDLLELEKNYSFLRDGISHPDAIHRADIRLSDISNLLGSDWVALAGELGVSISDVNLIKTEYPENVNQQAMVMLRLWLQTSGNKANGNVLEKALRKINRDDIVNQCVFNVELVTDDMERAVAKVHLDQSGFDNLREELGPSRDATLRRNTSLDPSYTEQDLMKESESVEELVKSEKQAKDKADEKIAEKERKDSVEGEKKYAAEEKDVKGIMEDFLSHEKGQTHRNEIQKVSDQLEKLDVSSPHIVETTVIKKKENHSPKSSKTPPPSPAEFQDNLGFSDSKPQLFGSHADSRTALDTSIDLSSHDGHIPTVGLHEEGPIVTSTPQPRLKPVRKASRSSHDDPSTAVMDDVQWDFGSDNETQGNVIVKTIRTIYGNPNAIGNERFIQNEGAVTGQVALSSSGKFEDEEFVNPIKQNSESKADNVSPEDIEEPPFSAVYTPKPALRLSKVSGSVTDKVAVNEGSSLPNKKAVCEEITSVTHSLQSSPGDKSDGGDAVNDLIVNMHDERCSTNSVTVNSDSDVETDSMASPLSGMRVSIRRRTIGSSSGSDVALHEGNDLSDDDHPGSDYFQGTDQQIFSETVTTDFDPATQRKSVTTRTVTATPTGEPSDGLRQSMQEIVDKFMQDERKQP